MLTKLRQQIYGKHATELILLVILASIGVASHIIWFIPETILFNADWLHWPDVAAKQAWQTVGTWNSMSGFGGPNIQVGFYLLAFSWALITNMGGSFDTAVKLTLMVPIAILGFVAPYILIRKLTSNKLASFAAALFYGSTTYFLLRQGAHLPIAFIYAFSPIIFFLFIKAMEKMRPRELICFSLAYAVGLCFEVRIMLLLSFVLALYLAFFFSWKNKKKQLLKSLLLISLVVLGLSCFWLLPSLLGGSGSTIAEVTSRSLFGNNLFDLPHALSLSPSGWTGGAPDENFVMQPVLLYLWLIPILALLPLFFFKSLSYTQRKQTLFFLVVALLGIFLTKQSVAPVAIAYQWLYDHLPGFSLFREASKFYQFTAWGYMGLLALGLVALKKKRSKLFNLAFLGIIGVGLINLYPLVSGSFGTLFVARHIPPDYKILNKKIMNDNSSFRILWVPQDSKWSYFDSSRSKVSAAAVVQKEWSPLGQKTENSISHKLFTLFQSPYINKLAEASSIKYVVVPLRDDFNDDDFFKYYGDDRQFYIDILNKASWLKKINIGTKELAIYENINYKPHISSLNNMYALSSKARFDQSYIFQKDKIKDDELKFIFNNNYVRTPTTHIKDVFSDIQPGDIKDGYLTKKIEASSNSNKLFINYNDMRLIYKLDSNILSYILKNDNELKIVNEPILKSSDEQVIYNKEIDLTKKYFIGFGDQLEEINSKETKQRNLGKIISQPHLYSAEDENLILNPSFENGLWKNKVNDCNAYDDNAVINMGISPNKKTDGKQSLKLESDLHIACTGPSPVKVQAGMEYLFSFDHIAKGSKKVGYEIEFNDNKKTLIKNDISSNSAWSTRISLVKIPKGASELKFKVKGYSNEENRMHAVTYYDNFKLTKLNLENIPEIDYKSKFRQINLTKNTKSDLSYKNTEYNYHNLIKNSSLENGLWQKKVGDCNSYDNKPKIDMLLSNEKSHGTKSLQLESERHIACTGPPPIKVKENSSYLFNFDYQSPNAKSATYYLSFNDEARTIIKENLPIKNTNWQHFYKQIKIPYGATKASILVYANSDESRGGKIINRYDNFGLIEIPDLTNRYYLVGKPILKLQSPKEIKFEIINPTKKMVHIKGAKTPFYLAMSESYHSDWQLKMNNPKTQDIWNNLNPWAKTVAIPENQHLKLNSFQNGWYINTSKYCQHQPACTQNSDGSYNIEMIIEFTPQRWFYVGLVISGITFIGYVTYLLYDWRKYRSSKIALGKKSKL